MPNRVVFTIFARDKFSAIARKIKASTAAMKTQFKSLNATIKKTSAKMKQIGSSLKTVSIAAAAGVAGSLKAFSDMEKGVTNVLTLLDTDQAEKFGGTIKKLATESLTKFGFTTEETTRALFDNVSALGTSEKSLQAFGAAQKLAIGGVTSLDVAVGGITSIMGAYSDGNQTAEEVGNAFFASQKAGKITVAELAANIGKVAPIAKSAGIGFEELLATMSQLTLGGLSAEEATTSLKGAITALLKPSVESQKILEAEGIAFGAAALSAQPFTKTLAQINKLREKNEDLLIKAIPNIQGFTAVAALEGDALENINKTVESMNENVLDPAFDKQMKTFSKSTELLRGNLVALGITIGDALAPTFLFIAAKIRGLIQWFQSLSDTTKKWISFGLLFVAVLAPLIIGLAVMMTVLAGIGAAFGVIFGFIFTVPVAIAAAIIAAGIAIFAWWDDIKKLGKAVAKFFGFGGDELSAEIGGDAQITQSSKATVEVNMNDPGGTIDNMKTTTSGNTPNLEVGTNLKGPS